MIATERHKRRGIAKGLQFIKQSDWRKLKLAIAFLEISFVGNKLRSAGWSVALKAILIAENPPHGIPCMVHMGKTVTRRQTTVNRVNSRCNRYRKKSQIHYFKKRKAQRLCNLWAFL